MFFPCQNVTRYQNRQTSDETNAWLGGFSRVPLKSLLFDFYRTCLKECVCCGFYRRFEIPRQLPHKKSDMFFQKWRLLIVPDSFHILLFMMKGRCTWSCL